MGSAAARMLNDAVRQRDAWRSLGALPGLMLRLGRLRTSLAERQAPALSRSAVFGVVLRFSKQALQSTLLALGAWLVIGQDATPGVMIGATILFGRLLAPLEGLQSGWRALQEGRFAAARLGGSLTQRRGNGSVVADGAGSGRSAPPRETASPAPARPCAAPAISLLECSFGWPGASRPLLKGVTLKLAPGELIALIGPAASGKTTLARLLLGLVQPSLGQLRLAGRSWAQLEADGDAPVCGYLGHDPMLFEGTIADHIAGGNAGQAPGGAVADAATAAGLADWISLLPRGYETRLGRDALEPSSNQARALALARLLYARPQLVVIDEPGAVTDGATARALTDAIQGLHRSGATVLLCTGRMHWARLAPRWLVLREGAIVDDGPRDAVVQRLGLQDKPMAEVEP